MNIIFVNINGNELEFEEYIKPLEKDGQNLYLRKIKNYLNTQKYLVKNR